MTKRKAISDMLAGIITILVGLTAFFAILYFGGAIFGAFYQQQRRTFCK